MALQLKPAFIIFVFVTTVLISLCSGQTPQSVPDSKEHVVASGSGQVQVQQSLGTIQGTIVDATGAVVGGARVQLTVGTQGLHQETRSGTEGQFSFANVVSGAFQLTVTAAAFGTQTLSGTLQAGEIHTVAPIALNVAEASTEVDVGLTQIEVAEEQLKVEEKQRVLGVIPNFYVSYIPNAVPLTAKEKFKLATRSVIDPFNVLIVGGTAGIEQAQNHFAGYGQGAQGYAKRFGATYADIVTGTFIGAAALPSLLKQDPRYFYKGTGSKASRFAYALANALVCKGDNGHWQANYSNIGGSLAAGALSNLYYPEQDRNGAGLTFENAAIGISATGIANLFQEFVVRRLTPKIPKQGSSKP